MVINDFEEWKKVAIDYDLIIIRGDNTWFAYVEKSRHTIVGFFDKVGFLNDRVLRGLHESVFP